jgi:nucleoside-diphosphate-sugar epimerase
MGVDESIPYPTSWNCHYPHSKALGEQGVLQANGTEDLKTCSLRPHLIWGPRDTNLFERLVERARSGRLRRVGEGNNIVDTVYVENAASAHLLAAEALEGDAPAAGRAYFISQGEPVNCWQWVDRLLAVAGLPPVKKAISRRAARGIGRICEVTYHTLRLSSEPPMTRFLADQLSTSHYYNISRARADLGYEPTISTEEGLERMAAVYSK